jgi:hypothetical protein
MDGASTETRTLDRGGRPLDPDRPTPESERPQPDAAQSPDAASQPGGAAPGAGGAPKDDGGTAGGSAGGPRSDPPGVIAQLKATKDAAMAMIRAHIALGRAEAEVIKGEVVHAAAFAGIAFAALLLLGVFLPIVTMLFLGEWLFGSIGWGVLLGSELLIAVAVTAVVLALKLEGATLAAAVGVIAGAVAFIIAGASWLNRLWTWVGDSTNLGIDAANRPLVIAIVVVGVIGALVGLIVGARAAGAGGAIGGLVAGLVGGGLVGAFLAYDFGWRVGAALGFATAYAVYLAVLIARVAANGIDTEKIKLRFWPQQTIETTRETIEWAKAQNPLGPKS